MPRDVFGALTSFLAVAEEQGFGGVATRLGVSRSSLSLAIRALEERMGVRLLARTTRSVTTTYAGERLLARLRPAMSDINSVLQELTEFRPRPAGKVKLAVSPLAAMTVLAPKLGEFTRAYPDVTLDVITDESRVDLISGRYDAGIHLIEFIQKDMIAVRVSLDMRAAIVASPTYFETRPKPVQRRDLLEHACLNYRHGDDVYRWEFEKGKREVTVSVSGPLVIDDVDVLKQAAIDGAGVTFLDEARVETELSTGALVRVLEDWCQPFPGFFLYYTSRRQIPAALGAVINTLRLANAQRGKEAKAQPPTKRR